MPADLSSGVGVIGDGPGVDGVRRRLAAGGVSVGADADVVVTLVCTEAQLRAVVGLRAAARERTPVVVDLSPVTPAVQAELDAVCRKAGIALFGGRLLTRWRDGAARATLYVDDGATNAPALRMVIAALADDVVYTAGAGRAKALGLIDDLLAGVNAAAVGEALALGRAAGLDAPTLKDLLQKGSGATAVLAHATAMPVDHVAQCKALARVAGAAHQADHSLWFGSVAIPALMGQVA